MFNENKIFIGKAGDEKVFVYPKMANRHGMIAGATGTGKTISLKVMAESFSECGVPVFLADVKGDLAGMCSRGVDSADMQARIEKFGLASEGFDYQAYPVNYWDIYEEKGLPLRTTISEMGPLLLARILGLNDTQTAILKVVFKIADDESILLIDTKDLRSMLTYVSENAKEYSLNYGNIAKQSLGTIIRSVIALEEEGGDMFFGEPALDIRDWLQLESTGKGFINILDCQKLINFPTMYSTFLLWMMSELFEILPEVGDMDKPRIVFFFDEAHLLFDNASKELMEKIEQVVKLIRSKGVGIYFITQSPKDIPDGVLGQLGTKIQHALHAYTPAEQKGVKIAAQSFRENPDFNTYDTLINLGVGEALVSVLDENGIPTIVQKCNILPPRSQMGPIDNATREAKINGSYLYTKYKEAIDRDSAYEFLQRKAIEDAVAAERMKEEAALEKQRAKEELEAKKAEEKAALAEQRAKERAEAAEEKARLKAEEKAAKEAEREAAKKKSAVKNAAKNVSTSVGGTLGRELGNAVGSSVGGSFGKKLGGNLGASLGRGIIGTLFKL